MPMRKIIMNVWTPTTEFRTTWSIFGLKWQIKELTYKSQHPEIGPSGNYYRWKTIGIN